MNIKITKFEKTFFQGYVLFSFFMHLYIFFSMSIAELNDIHEKYFYILSFEYTKLPLYLLYSQDHKFKLAFIPKLVNKFIQVISETRTYN